MPLPNRKTVRLCDCEYSEGEYFVTICTSEREHYFGEIENGEIRLSALGAYLQEQIENVQKHYPYAEIPLFAIMPNHIHLVVFINGEMVPYDRRDAARHVPTGKNECMFCTAHNQDWLSVVIGGIKSAVTRFANENNIKFAWQPRFYEHIIRNQTEMNNIANYIEQNPYRWETDEYNN